MHVTLAYLFVIEGDRGRYVVHLRMIQKGFLVMKAESQAPLQAQMGVAALVAYTTGK